MATLEWCCSFDHLSTADLGDEWTLTNTPTLGATGRNGTNGFQIQNHNEGANRACTAAATKCFGFSFEIDAYPTADRLIFSTFDGATRHVDIRMTSAGKLKVTRNGTQLGSDSTNVYPLNTPHYLEIKVFIDDTTGTVEVRVDETNSGWFNLTGQDTRNAGSAQVTNYTLFADSGSDGVNITVDDFYVADDFLGDMRVAYLAPSGNGNSSQLTGSDGNSTDNYLLVDETDPDDDTTYVESATADQKDTYAMANLPSAASTIHGVLLIANARKDDAGARNIALIARLSGTEADSADLALSTTYDQYDDMRTTKPGGGAWGTSDPDSMEVGVKVR